MSLIEQVGTYRGEVVDKAVSVSTNGYPQLVALLRAGERYDDEVGDWVAWEADESELTAYLVLFDGQDRKTLNCTQVEKVLGWDGASFAGLNAIDHSETLIQFRVVENTYNEKTTMQVEWIDEYGATPGRTVRKLDAIELKDLDAAYAGMMNKPKAKPASAKASPLLTATQAQAQAQAAAGKKAPPKVPAKKGPPKTTAASSDGKPAKKLTKQEAWDGCVDLKDKKVKDEQLSQVWVDTVDEVRGPKEEADLTPEDWGRIQDLVMDKTAMF